MLSNDIVFQRGQIFVEDDRNDDIVLFRYHRVEAVIGNQMAVTRIQPDGSLHLMLYTQEDFRRQMVEEEPEEWYE